VVVHNIIYYNGVFMAWTKELISATLDKKLVARLNTMLKDGRKRYKSRSALIEKILLENIDKYR
jgi:metal-responsive CopG/Arc/MetJ family transcriptional regulator